ncbi:heterokaryon incompatibility protein-domain-containing protein [Schizothecium vesticola]|uniref:Heterokaryon incompatibility protein-domain-containing protein n=1 Tax=Schizothecium vesticola TaxID=314040 RepID=A0AA40EQC7_9PEZI|nr:heterokaryon incompatibility protein-domain-containing protein [Schizothecium vesticola]
MACDFCRQTIFASTNTWGYHRPVYSSVPGTVEHQDIGDCSVCSVLQNRLATARKAAVSSDEKPIFCWFLSKPARIRGSSSDYFTLVFRPVDDDASLPPVTLHLFRQTTLGAPPHLPTRTDAPQSWNQARTWMRECQATHTRCGAPSDSFSLTPTIPSVFPTRLIDVQSPLLPSDRLLLVRSDAPSFVKAPYLTLSHCWGGSLDPVKTLERNLERRMDPEKGLSLDELPANFAHAIEVARRLDVRYIWIDAVCIVQDGPDFGLEGPKMHSVYRNSACTIAAVDAPDSSTGFLSDRPPGESPFRLVQGEGEWTLENHWWVCLDGDMWKRDVLGRVLYTRGWVFQERMLSPRILHYSAKQVFWDCAEKTACESLPAGLPLPLDASAEVDRQWREHLRIRDKQLSATEREDGGTIQLSFQRFWRDAVRNYTRCNLTNIEDRLVAIWGIAKVMREELHEYGEGLWELHLCEELAWRVVHSPERVAVKRMDLGPTWSWAWTIASIEPVNRFQFNENTRHAKNHTGERLGLDLEPFSRGCLMGESHPVLKTWRIAIRGALVPAYMVETAEPGSWSISLPGMPGTPGTEASAFPDVLPEGKQQECLLIALAVTPEWRDDSRLVVGLILDRNSSLPGEYRRLGIFRLSFPGGEAHAQFGTGHQEENIWLV